MTVQLSQPCLCLLCGPQQLPALSWPQEAEMTLVTTALGLVFQHQPLDLSDFLESEGSVGGCLKVTQIASFNFLAQTWVTEASNSLQGVPQEDKNCKFSAKCPFFGPGLPPPPRRLQSCSTSQNLRGKSEGNHGASCKGATAQRPVRDEWGRTKPLPDPITVIKPSTLFYTVMMNTKPSSKPSFLSSCCSSHGHASGSLDRNTQGSVTTTQSPVNN